LTERSNYFARVVKYKQRLFTICILYSPSNADGYCTPCH